MDESIRHVGEGDRGNTDRRFVERHVIGVVVEEDHLGVVPLARPEPREMWSGV